MRMVEYVRGSQRDNWHWCKNCSQYPLYIFQRYSAKDKAKPPNLCEQCKAKEQLGTCECSDTNKTQNPKLKRDIPLFCKPYYGEKY